MARNPFADAIKLPFTPDIYFYAGPNHRTAADLQLQPLIPNPYIPGMAFYSEHTGNCGHIRSGPDEKERRKAGSG